MTDTMQKQMTELRIEVGQMKAGVDDMRRLQADVVELLRKHDRTDTKVEQLTDLVARHEDELQLLRTERISNEARRDYQRWWLSNWKNVALLLILIGGGILVMFPNLKPLISG